MKAVIVDDELAARGLLRKRLAPFPDVEIIGEAENELQAIDLINQLQPDLVFLDIQMTVLSGFEVLRYLNKRPLIIFCTAHDHYAVRAFEEKAMDYLLKPVDPDRLARCLERVRHELKRDQALERLEEMEEVNAGIEQLVCEVGNKHMIIPLSHIREFGKEGRYTYCLTKDRQRGLINLTMDYLSEHISDANFFRINRGSILHKDSIASFQMNARGAEITTTTGEQILVSRRRVREFKAWAAG